MSMSIQKSYGKIVRLSVGAVLAAALAQTALAEEAEATSSSPSVTEAAKEVGHGVKEGAVAVGHGVKEGAIAVGHAAKKGAQAVGRGAKKVGHAVSHAAHDVKDDLTSKSESESKSDEKSE
jgi:hypothetical protein